MNKKSAIILAVLAVVEFSSYADPRFGSLKLTSQPDSAQVFLDRILKGKTPIEISAIPPGKHLLTVVKSGCRRYTRDLVFEGGKRIVGNATLDTLTGEQRQIAQIQETVRKTVNSQELEIRLKGAVEQMEMKEGLFNPSVMIRFLDSIMTEVALPIVDPKADRRRFCPVKVIDAIFPELAETDSVQEGLTQVLMILGKDGSVKEAEVQVSSGHLLLDDAAVSAARQWCFETVCETPEDTAATYLLHTFIISRIK